MQSIFQIGQTIIKLHIICQLEKINDFQKQLRNFGGDLA